MVTIEKTRINAWNAGGFAVAIAVTAFGWGITYNAMTSANADAVKQIEALSGDVKDIRGQLPTIGMLQSRMDRTTEIISDNKAAIKATNERMDRVVESFSDKLDVIVDKTNKIATSVEVLSSRMGEAPKRTRFLLK